MPLNVLYADRADLWPAWQAQLRAACSRAGLDITLHRNTDAGAAVDYIVYSPDGPVRDFTPYPNLKAVLSTWAGVDSIVGNATITVPLTRMSDAGLVEGMTEYVTGHVLRYHLGLDAHIRDQSGDWRRHTTPPLARNRQVGILGFGALGQACGRALSRLNFDVHGWSRSPKDIAWARTHHGSDGLRNILGLAEILVLLLPDTPRTQNLIDVTTIAQMRPGTCLINAGRGTSIDDDALLAATQSGHIAHATLDVFRTEPLPPDHPFWASDRITVTPHTAAETRPETAAEVIAENIRRAEAGEPLLHLVDRAAGY